MSGDKKREPTTSATPNPLTTNAKANRLPAPTLFVGPPSRNASQLSVIRAGADANHPKATGETLQRKQTPQPGPVAGSSPPNHSGAPTLKTPSDRSIDAKWRNMQGLLDELEFTAESVTRVFGESHAKALNDLREAQVGLAGAWGRSNEGKTKAASEEPIKNVASFGAAREAKRPSGRSGRDRADTHASNSTVLSDESFYSGSSANGNEKGSQMKDETAEDINLASERRAANEAYFKKVEQGVKEVVEKLEMVAEAMRGVEGESRSLWIGESGSSEAERLQPSGGSTNG